MTPRQMQYDFEYKVNKYDSELIIDSNIIFYWINEAQDLQVITDYTGNTPYGQGFEQDQKRTDDLKELVVEVGIIPTPSTSQKENAYMAAIPTDYLFRVGEEVDIEFNALNGDPVTKRQGVTECTADTYTALVHNPYGQFVLHYETAEPLRLYIGNNVELITDGNYTINKYILRYLKRPAIIELGGSDCELSEHVHSRIIDKAVNLYLESTSDSRYQTSKAELSNKE